MDQAALAARRYGALATAANSPVMLALARDGTVLASNPAARALLGGEGQWAALPAGRLDRAWAGELAPFEWPVEADGRRRMLYCSLQPVLADDQVAELLLIGMDITAQAEGESALRRRCNELQQRIQAQSRDLMTARDEATAANHARSAALANMSHELHTPMHAILSFARLGRERVASAAPERLAEYFQRILESGDRLLELLGDLLDLARLEAGKVVLAREVVDLYVLAIETGRQFESLIESKSLTLEIVAPPQAVCVLGDRLRLRQVLTNLLSNAIKFTPPGGRVTIDFAIDQLPAGRRAGDRDRCVPAVTLRIVDTGVGIADEDLERIFDKFFQGSRTRTGAGGVGLGLAISREIVEAHLGEIRARSFPNGGALFEVTLPEAGDDQ